MNSPFDLASRKALVTGSSRGIGNAIAMALGRAGAHVVFHGTSESTALLEALKRAELEGLKYSHVLGDIGSTADIDALAENAGNPDIVVLNASVQKYITLGNFEEDEFERTMRCNLRSCFQLIKRLAPHMVEQKWGRIISIGSINQAKPAGRLSIYAASKAAQLNLMLTAAKEYAAQGVTVNTITPGVIVTDRNRDKLRDEAFADTIMQSIPAARFGTAEDCAGVAVMLASEAGSYITGADIPVAGGMQL